MSDTALLQRRPSTFQDSLDQVAILSKQFTANKTTYLSPTYNEALARQEFIDNLFIALGWDVRNYERRAPQVREVVLEHSLEIEDDTRKAPDYSFQWDASTRFFVEAKRPLVHIKQDPGPALQIRSYAWNAKLPVSLVTDFEEFAIYEGVTRPSSRHKAHVARLDYLTYDQYPDRWREIWDLFSKGAVREGALQKFASREKRGTSQVDDEFLREIEGWRDRLARNIALRNRKLSSDDINDAVQKIIDRVVFLRMAEDKYIEPYKKLFNLANKEAVFQNFTQLCQLADSKYNSGIFDFSPKGDSLTPRLTIDDDVLGPILSDLYPPKSPYRFNILPVEILGSVYEQFLGKVIRLTEGHHAKIEEKPDVRKAGGVYYTPAYIVDYIVNHTVGTLIKGKGPKQLREFRVLDMACGSGSFLLGAYQALLRHYAQWYLDNEPSKHPKAVWKHNDVWRLTMAERKRILTAHLFGTDIDRQAVEVTKLSLLLKALEGETNETLGHQLPGFEERALPDLGENIKCGNSLIAPDFFSGHLFASLEEAKLVNGFDWAREFPQAMSAGGFDCVIGNPPYIDSEWMTKTRPGWREYCVKNYGCAKGNWDIFCLFVEKGIELTRNGGFASMIVPNKMLSADYAQAVRQFIAREHTLQILRDYSRVPVFPVSVYPVVYVIAPGKTRSSVEGTVEVMSMNAGTLRLVSTRAFPRKDIETLDGKSWAPLVSGAQSSIPDKMKQRGRLLAEIAVVNGAATVAEAYDMKKLLVEFDGRSRNAHQFINTGSIDRFVSLWAARPTRYIKEVFSKPVVPLPQLGKLTEKRQREVQAEKIVIGGMNKRLECLHDPGGFVAGKSTTIVMGSKISLKYLLALLNSRLMSYFYRREFEGLKLAGDFYRIGPPQVGRLPVFVPTEEQKPLVDRVIRLVEQISEARSREVSLPVGPQRKPFERQVATFDAQIDKLVYEFYGLSESDIAEVEQSFADSKGK